MAETPFRGDLLLLGLTRLASSCFRQAFYCPSLRGVIDEAIQKVTHSLDRFAEPREDGE